MAIKEKRPRKRWRRRILLHGGVLLVCILIVFIVALFTPFTSDLLDAKVIRAFEQATGLRLSFDGAVYWLGRGRMTLSEIRIEVPETGQRITGIHQMYLQWKWHLLQPSDPFDLRKIEIAAPEPVVFHLEKDLTLAPDAGAQSFLDFMRGLERGSQRPASGSKGPEGGAAKPAEPQIARSPVKIVIRNFALYLEEREDPSAIRSLPISSVGNPLSALSNSHSKRLAGMEAMELEMEYNGITIWPLTISGRLWGKPAAPFAMMLEGGAGNREFRFSAELNALDLTGNLQKSLPLILRGSGIKANGRLLSGESAGTDDIEVSIKAHDLMTSFTQAGLAFPKTDFECETFAALDHTSRTITLKSARVLACQSEITASGKIALDGAKAFSVEIGNSSLSPEILNPLVPLLLRQFAGSPAGQSAGLPVQSDGSGRSVRSAGHSPASPSPDPQSAISSGRLQIRGHVSGDSGGIAWADCRGDAQVTGLMVENVPLAEKPVRVGPVDMDARLTSASLEVPRLSVQVLSNNLTLSSARIARQSKLEAGGLRPEPGGDRGLGIADCGLKTENSEIRNPREIRDPDPQSAIRNPKLENPQSAIRNPQSSTTYSLQSPVSSLKGREVRANWNLEAKIEEVVEILPSKELRQVRAWKPKGQVRGNGTIRGEWPVEALGFGPETVGTNPQSAIHNPQSPTASSLKPQVSSLSRLEALLQHLKLDGLLQLEGFCLDPERFPAPLEEGAGTLFLSGQTVRLSSVTAAMLGSSLSLEGQITGAPFVWNRPEADVRLRGNLDLSQAPRWVTPEMMQNERRAAIKRMAPSGKVALDLDLTGPLLEPAKLSLKGSAVPSSVSLTLDTTSPTITFSGIQGKIQLDLPRELRLDPFQMDVQAQGAPRPARVTVSGPLSNAGLDLNWQTSGDLPHYKQLLPWMLDYFQVDGPVALSGHAQASLKRQSENGAPFPATLAGLADYLRKEFLAQEDSLAGLVRINQILDWDFNAQLEASDCEFTHIFMPSRVTRIFGRFQIDKDGLRTVLPIRAQWGATDALTEGRARLQPDGVLRIDFTTSAPLIVADDWVQRWGPRHPKPCQASDETAEIPQFDPAQKDSPPIRVLIDGTLIGQRGTFLRFPFENASGHFQFRDYKSHSSFLEFDSIKAGLFGGDFRMMRTWLYTQAHRFRWNTEVAMDGVDCGKLLKAHYGDSLGDDLTVTGLLSTRTSLQGTSSERNPLEGAGAFAVKNSRFRGNPVFLALGQLLGSKELEDISFTKMEGSFSIRGKDIFISLLSLAGSLMELEAQGTATTDGALDLEVVYRFLKFIPELPVLKYVVRAVEDVTSWFVKAHLGGTLRKPQLLPVPLSVDKLTWPPFSKKNGKAKEKDLTGEERATSPSLSPQRDK